MKIHRFYIGQGLRLGVLTFVPDTGLQNQLQNVFRLKVGDEIIAFDGSGFDYVSTIESYSKGSVSLIVKEKNKNIVVSTREVYLFASIVKKDNFEWIVEKATEMGVSRIIPVVSERSEKKNLNNERLNKIIIEASEQSGRAVLPVLEEICTLKLALEKYKDIKSIVFHTSGEKFVSQDIGEGTVGCYVGPEGGWSEKEIEMFKDGDTKIRTLGPQVLRAETAVVATLSQLVF